MACILQMGATWKTLGLVLSAHAVFIFATWEEYVFQTACLSHCANGLRILIPCLFRYYSGSLQLPIINGPTEGILIGIGLKFLTAALGPSFWTQEIIPGYQNNTIFVLTTIGSTMLTLLVKYVFAGLCWDPVL